MSAAETATAVTAWREAQAAPGTALELAGVTKRFGRAAALDRVDLAVRAGEFLAVLGPSGCGKTTLLRTVAGFESIDEGAIHLGGRPVSAPGRHVPAEDRRIGIVFQSYALWPHLTVAGNVGYPLTVAGIRGAEQRRRVAEALALVGLEAMADRRPEALSGGQRQRVALARCLVMAPSLVLLDEPLANLDVHLRASMEEEFADFHRRTGATMVYITHDQAEAMALADRIAVMDHGRIVQVAAPAELYREPATGMVAGFIGRGSVVAGLVTGPAADGRAAVRFGSAELTLRCRPGQRPGPALLCFRPEDLVLDRAGGIAARVTGVRYKGGQFALKLEAAGDALALDLRGDPPAVGAEVRIIARDGWVVPAD